ncbi:50S ribosomal protein L30 [Sporothrix schenckii 1099-18]|uniref:Large ribosomal subunit protein uL30m n=2 Tax=Sporothrix schenckii TaxID=29908 RepID=U7PUI1_SPOS1|nr:50S ribosomal protein L30 [Sporothrix schenckii 1099-18]ERS99262.1 ribosomal protein L30 [Sporothrix schenckii ATCC 58251]KJR83044.1 50S ribosomal protein L30 [Sporothrix schenckii 1099-18]
MSFFQVTLNRSAIGLPQRTRDALAALGLRRRNQTVVHAVSPSSAGMIFSVKELVKVKEVSEGREATLAKLKAARRPDPGFVVARKYHDLNEQSRQESGPKSSL